MPQRERPEHRDRLRRPRPAGRHPARRRQRGAPLPDPQSVVRPPRGGSRRSRARCSTTSGWPGTQPSTLKWSRESRRRSDPASGRRCRRSASRSGPTCSASPIARLDYSIPQEPAGGERAVDVQSRTDVLERPARRRRGRRGWPAGRLASSLAFRSPPPVLSFSRDILPTTSSARPALLAACGRRARASARWTSSPPRRAARRRRRSSGFPQERRAGASLYRVPSLDPSSWKAEDKLPAGASGSSAPTPSRAWSSRSTASATWSRSTSRPGGSAPISSRSAPRRWAPTARSTPSTPAAP